ncbi:hypothetical protein QUF50_10175, partial [Thiotrichales bacterium HSG1]|nr:hypothetical protein [Thiotrichales bacterium HSG1]
MSELSIIKIIMIGLQYLNPYYVADVFLIISIALFLIAIYKNIQIIPTLLAGLGIFTAIIIVSISISNFDSNTIENSIPDLLNGLAIAIILGFINLIFILVLRFINNRKLKKISNNEITPTAIYLTLRELSTYNNVTQKNLLNNIFKQLSLIQENSEKTLQLHENLEKKHISSQNIMEQINFISDNKLAQFSQTFQPYLKDLQQFHISVNDTFPKIEQSLTELTKKMQQVLQNNLKLLENSVETQLDMAGVIVENLESDKFKT